VRSELPAGTVTFLFTDVEGSTRLLHELGPDAYAEALAEHRRVVREAVAAHGGVEVDTQGDAFFVAFPTAPGALQAAADVVRGLAAGPIRVRMGIHTGTPHLSGEGYVGVDVHRAARIAACGRGGQVLVSAATAALAGSDGLRDLGEHRLKDLSAPEHIYQLGDDEFPPLKTLHQTNLPIPSTPFLGREHELLKVLRLLSRQDVRLLTLTGPGGTGKTRLAAAAAGELGEQYPHGVWWIPLAPLRDPELVLETVAQTLGAKDGLVEHIADRSMLLLLDNFEQVVLAAPDVAELLTTCPKLELLVTSRERLHVTGEHEYAVPPLVHEEGVGFFLARARAVRSDFQADDAVSEICRRLDDLPLALELAAARVKALSSQQILERLEQRLPLLTGGARDLPERQRTLRATIEWSYDLLTADEQQLFARLAVFRGGCTVDTAEQVADAGLDDLQSLLDKSLLRQTDERFSMLETIREYATERLEQSGDAETVRTRHFRHVLALAERAYDERLTQATSWLLTLETEHDNVRAALDWARSTDPRGELQLAGAVAPYWVLRGRAAEARDRLAGALERYKTRDGIRARALTHFGEAEDDQTEALRRLDEAAGLWRELGDPLGEALALEATGWIHDDTGNYSAAQRAQEQSLTLRREAGAPELESARSLAGLCHVLVASGVIDRAERMAQELLELGTAHGASRAEQIALHFLADCLLVAGDYEEAETRYLRALAHARRSGLVVRCIDEVMGIAMSAAGQGDATRAARLAAAAYAQQEALGLSTDRWWGRMQEWFIGGARAQLSPEERQRAERSGTSISFDALLDEVLAAGRVGAAEGSRR
jgi:predicted ATPase/class 3 adenylate cyclase